MIPTHLLHQLKTVMEVMGVSAAGEPEEPPTVTPDCFDEYLTEFTVSVVENFFLVLQVDSVICRVA